MADAAEDLIVDLRDRRLVTLDDFWDAVAETCALPGWFGRNLDAWWDAVETGGVSAVIDAHRSLTVRARAQGLFAPGSPDGQRLSRLFAEATRARLDLAG
ncbi:MULTISPECIES: barstar family protein [Streptomyces]|uniref:Barstar (barnase inhibitor) domain-containing protein n=1 Tax=Streptomyces lycii TaxID=2654337 RepID=A0ABQ7FIB0_9ACTN|nr:MULTISPECIES: barstar family protein [Streptomyces]KAF4408104.1 hypothetical protein GCU69_16210 [Streptomyces lycii]PGH49473.1 hypothetical protein CRI70_17460 [Streptomyces sp. Ru87]